MSAALSNPEVLEVPQFTCCACMTQGTIRCRIRPMKLHTASCSLLGRTAGLVFRSEPAVLLACAARPDAPIKKLYIATGRYK